jgi:hypothetical protein
LMGHPVAGRSELPADGTTLSELEQGVSGHGGQYGGVPVLGGQILLLDGGHDGHV